MASLKDPHRHREPLVVTNKKRVRCQLTGEDAERLPISEKFGNADIAHFGNLRGSNEFENHDAVIISAETAQRRGRRTTSYGDMV